MADESYKLLLAAASHSHLQRHAHQQERLVGNVFLPSIQRRSAPHAALSMKHLQVIEQCIIAENRREAQLSQCASEKERRFLSRRFQAQRSHERDLIEALMLGQPADRELEIVDVERQAAVRAGRQSPLARAAGPRRAGPPNPALASAQAKAATVGVQFAMESRGKVFCKPLGSPQRAKGSASAKPRALVDTDTRASDHTVLPSCSPSRSKGALERPRETMPAASPSRSPAKSPTHCKPPQRLPVALASSPLRASPQASPKKHKAREASVPVRSTLSVAPQEPEEPMTVAFDGATSFLEARACAMEIVHEQMGLVEGGTQTTARCDAAALPDSSDLVLVLAQPAPIPLSAEARKARPHTSPEKRRRPPHKDLPAMELSHSGSGAALKEIEYFRLTRDDPLLLLQQHPGGVRDAADERQQSDENESYARSRSVATFVSEDSPSKRIHVVPKESLRDVLRQELTWPEQSGYADEACYPQGWEQPADDSELSSQWAERSYDYDDSAAEPQSEGFTVQPDVRVVDLDEGASADTTVEEVASVLSELVEMVEIVVEEEESAARVAEPSRGRASSVIDVTGTVVRIQSAFRGHMGRRAFRFALYQEALNCGVLGAMPGTTQGKTGWYQDPKTRMAYYFVVAADGAWTQKIVLRCSALILSPYEMHEQILSKVFIQPLRSIVNVVHAVANETTEPLSADAVRSRLRLPGHSDREDLTMTLQPYTNLKNSLINAEQTVLRGLGFDVEATLPHGYLFNYAHTMSIDTQVVACALALVNDALLEPKASSFPPFVLAAACLRLAQAVDDDGARSVDADKWWYRFDTSDEDIEAVARLLQHTYDALQQREISPDGQQLGGS
ncbi:hypothetical protein P43SY_009172 [Pythium insidiosum]|uniref:Cyclin-like domain-containing protein n=1 Tax=Pythium insidiosum TaxID=114742 RepID=A0AAD5QE36_PYTIN|nr:hypothetical protein P43SY_009172 [Pythium insidiosum]